ncbi:HNH endonuclease [Kitasatospora sp. DSM 101779]|uniref:HNH endonuclease n=1 Tax=Kitasatospora sp. DSM 101779 TaxID=2853165 RepID=UPI0021D8A871|nr:HNH endonuclease [Kitasatospora sp. DSM 101779]MCU7823501.1 HNH endonuclease [Kitasatospora sp. DSM 101779]
MITATVVRQRVGELAPAERDGSRAPHRPLLLLWALAQAVQRRPRLQPWSRIQPAAGALLTRFGGVADPREAVVYPFWSLQKSELWEIEDADSLELTSRDRRPKRSALDGIDPRAGLLEDVHELLAADRAFAAELAATLLVRFFNPVPKGLVEALGLDDLLMGRVAEWLQPRVGDRFTGRFALSEVHGGQRIAGIGKLHDGMLNAFSDDKGPYRDGRIAGTDWIAYVGDGQRGDQALVRGNKSMAIHQEQQRPLRFWHKPYGGEFTFESWVVIAQRRLRWGRGNDDQWRREFVWVLAPVPSPLKDHWPHEILEVLAAEGAELHDDTGDVIPTEVMGGSKTPAEKYRHLCMAAETTEKRRQGQRSRQSTIERVLRSAAARDAVLLRSGGRCENPTCLGHPTELTDAGAPLLEVDHVKDLARGGPDRPEFMIALCPNCHALKTRGTYREQLRGQLLDRARALHAAALASIGSLTGEIRSPDS